jgi:hypothetical protein
MNPSKRTCLLMVSIFLLSRFMYWKLGIRFYGETITWYFQYLDVPLLKHDLLISCYFLHSQPPLFNIFLGIILQLFPLSSQYAFHACFLLCGFILYWSIFSILTRIVSLKIALIASTCFIISPQIIIYENWLFYSYPVCTLLILVTHSLIQLIITAKMRYAFFFFSLIGCICLIRSSFHLIYYVGCVLFIYYIFPKKRAIVMYAAVPIMTIVLCVYAKNAFLFGEFGTSSWMGMNLWKIARICISEKELEQLKLNENLPTFISLKSPFQESTTIYPKEFWAIPSRFQHVAALTDDVKTSGAINFNYYGYLHINRGYMKASLCVIKKYPLRYLSGILSAWLHYLKPSAEYPHLNSNIEKIAMLVKWRRWLYDHTTISLHFLYRSSLDVNNKFSQTSLISLVVLLGILAGGIWFVAVTQNKNNKHIILFCLLTIFYIAIITNLLDFGENSRFRFETNPLYFIIFCVLLEKVCIKIKALTYSFKQGSDTAI